MRTNRLDPSGECCGEDDVTGPAAVSLELLPATTTLVFSLQAATCWQLPCYAPQEQRMKCTRISSLHPPTPETSKIKNKTNFQTHGRTPPRLACAISFNVPHVPPPCEEKWHRYDACPSLEAEHAQAAEDHQTLNKSISLIGVDSARDQLRSIDVNGLLGGSDTRHGSAYGTGGMGATAERAASVLCVPGGSWRWHGSGSKTAMTRR